MKIVEITESNYQDYLNIDIKAFSYAYGGAMGEGGGIYIIDADACIYHANYCWGDDCIDERHIIDIIPVFEDIQFGVFGNRSTNDGWDSVYLGFGNHLVMVKSIFSGFRQKAENANYNTPGDLFQHWPGMVLELIEKGDGNLTMNDVGDLRSND
jgi:hypothetical protein